MATAPPQCHSMHRELGYGEDGADHRDDVYDQRPKDQAEDAVQNFGLDRLDPRLEAQLSFAQGAAQSRDCSPLRSPFVANSAPSAASCTVAITASACGSVKPASRSLFATFNVSIIIALGRLAPASNLPTAKMASQQPIRQASAPGRCGTIN